MADQPKPERKKREQTAPIASDKKHDLVRVIGITNVGANESVFQKFEAGGSARAKNGGMKAIPTAVVRPDIKRVIPAGKRLRQLKGAFRVNSIIYQHKGRGKNETIRAAYILKPSVRTRPLLGLVPRITRSVERD